MRHTHLRTFIIHPEFVYLNEKSCCLSQAIVELLEAKPKASLKDVMYAARQVSRSPFSRDKVLIDRFFAPLSVFRYAVHDVRRAAKGAFSRRWTSLTEFKHAKALAALARWNPQVRVFLSLRSRNMSMLNISKLSSNDPLVSVFLLTYFNLFHLF